MLLGGSVLSAIAGDHSAFDTIKQKVPAEQ